MIPPSAIRRSPATALLALSIMAACRPAAPGTFPAPMAPVATLVRAEPAAVGMRSDLGARLDSIARASIAAGTAPGMAIAVGRYGRLVHLAGYGHTDWATGSSEVDERTIYDLASLTKVVATTTAAMLLEAEGKLALDSTVAHYLPEFGAADSAKQPITVRMLLTHTGGLEAFARLYEQGVRGREQYLQQIAARPMRSIPGGEMVYSDWDMILMQLVIERITGQPLDEFVDARVFRPLGMGDTGFRPDPSLRPRIAPTENDTTRGGLLWGVVHDGNAWAIGGVSGHAGLFSSARDLATFAQMMLHNGRYGAVALLSPRQVARWTAPQLPYTSRALGWDTPSPPSSAGIHFGPRSYGHTGFTGTSMWMDPERGVFVVILANRVNSRGMTTTHTALRRDIANAVQESILDAPLMIWEAERK
ncbi:MAG TPA: serine hydrolase [Gemmatimonadales bacterium]